MNTSRFLKYVWPFYKIMHERVKNIVITFSRLLKWPLYAALLLFFFDRSSSPEEALSLQLRNIPPKRQLKPQTNKKKTNYFLTNNQNRKKLNFFKTTISQRTIIVLSLFNLHLFNLTFHQKKPAKCQNNISSCHAFTCYCSVHICSILPFINVFKHLVFSISKSNQKCV